MANNPKKYASDSTLSAIVAKIKELFVKKADLNIALSVKADSSHTHSISDTTNLQSTLDAKVPTSRTVNGKALTANITLSASDVGAAPSTHDHNSIYYTQSQVDSKLGGKSDTSHNHDSVYEAKNTVSTHNTSTSAHNDIRDLITGLTNRLNALADSDDTTLDQLSEIVAYIKANKTLIDSITTSKVNVSDIIDNLETNVSNKPLSAAQGVAIKTLIDALQADITSLQDSLDTKVSDTDLTYGVDSSVQTVSARYARVAFGAGKFVALPYRADTDSKFLYSTNGKEWNEISAPVNAAWKDIVYGDNKFVAISSTSTSGGYYGAYSSDGLSWTIMTLPSGGSPASIAYGNGRFVYVGSSTVSGYSTDGINWTKVTLPTANNYAANYPATMLFANGKFIIPSTYGDTCLYSTNGASWTVGTWASGSISKTVYGADKFVTVGNGTVKHSIDGNTWVDAEVPVNLNWYALAYGNGLYIVMAYGSASIIYSSDGISWETAIIAESNSWCDLAFGNGTFVAVTEGAYSLLTIVFGNKYGLAYQSDVEKHITTALANKVDKTDIHQSDWNQNDSSAIDYIKNRTHWVEQGVDVIFEEKSIPNDYEFSELTDVTPPDSIIVTIDNVAYQCEHWTNSTGEDCYGDSRLITRYDWDTDTEVIDTTHSENVPFYISAYADDGGGMSWTFTWYWYIRFKDNSSHIVKIEALTGEDTYHQLDERFIPSAVARTSTVNAISNDLADVQLQIDTKANIVPLTTDEYEALEEAEATNANTLYMLTDAEEETPTQVQIITWEDDD